MYLNNCVLACCRSSFRAMTDELTDVPSGASRCYRGNEIITPGYTYQTLTHNVCFYICVPSFRLVCATCFLIHFSLVLLSSGYKSLTVKFTLGEKKFTLLVCLTHICDTVSLFKFFVFNEGNCHKCA